MTQRELKSFQAVLDNTKVVFDIGSAYTKYGYVGEPCPRRIIKTEVRCPETKKIRKVFDYKNEADLYQLLVEFVDVLFFRHVLRTPKLTRVLIVENPLASNQFRDTLAKVMFRHFEIISYTPLPTHLSTISVLATDTVLVLDVGYKEATLIPIFEGIPILKAWQALPLGGQAVHENIRKYLKEVLPNREIPEDVIEDIKVRACFVTTLERAMKFGTDDEPTPPPSVTFPGVKSVPVSGKLRERAYEVLWERDNDNLSVSTMVLDALLKCSIDARKRLAENILLIGGTTMAQGFASRFKSELYMLVQSDLYKDKLKIKTFKFHTAPSHQNYTAWLGGMIYFSSGLGDSVLTKENYAKLNRVPDWTNLIDNVKMEMTRCTINV